MTLEAILSLSRGWLSSAWPLAVRAQDYPCYNQNCPQFSRAMLSTKTSWHRDGIINSKWADPLHLWHPDARWVALLTTPPPASPVWVQPIGTQRSEESIFGGHAAFISGDCPPWSLFPGRTAQGITGGEDGRSDTDFYHKEKKPKSSWARSTKAFHTEASSAQRSVYQGCSVACWIPKLHPWTTEISQVGVQDQEVPFIRNSKKYLPEGKHL